ncbi:MAG: NUDIX domain-containing protein [Candidatus Woesearchaeota archaeon]
MNPNIIVVDENDNIINHKSRQEVDEKGLIYRVSALWIKNSKGESLLARRAFSKSHSPGLWGPAVAGTVEQGESYEDSIIKEAEEELGLNIFSFEKGPKIRSKDKYPHFTQWFTCKIDRPVKEFSIQKDEVAEIKWFSRQKIEKQLKANPEEFLINMQKYLEMFY